VLPFEVTSPQRLDYLRETLVHLLAGRIAERSGATVVPPWKVVEALQSRAGSSLTDQEARDLGRSFGARYVLSARFTTVGEGFRIDGRMLDVASDREAESVTVNGEKLASLMPRLGELADALTKTFPATPRPSLPAAGVLPPTGQVPSAPGVSPGTSWVSRRLPLEIRGIGLGDVDGDGTNEIVVLAKREVHVYRRQANDLTLLTSYQLDRSLEGLAVDVADRENSAFLLLRRKRRGNQRQQQKNAARLLQHFVSYGRAKAMTLSALDLSPRKPPPVAVTTTYCFPSLP